MKGVPISGLDFVKDMEDLWVFHAGTAKKNEIVTNGGRVHAVTAMGDTIRKLWTKHMKELDV